MDKRIGIIGLGIMGGAFARHLAAEGWTVIGFDIDAARIAEARAAGVEVAGGAAAVAEAASAIITSLPTPAAALEVARAIATVEAKGRIVAEASTLALEDKLAFQRILAEGGHTALDCPVSGTGAQAAVRDLVVFASGDANAVATVTPALAGFSRKVWDLGPYGNGSKMKFVANHLVAIHNVAAAEALVLAMKAGLDPRKVVEVVGSGAGTSRMLEVRGPMMAESRYWPATVRSTIWKKDVSVIGEFAAGLACPTPLFDLSASLYRAALAMGYADADTASVCAVLERMAGLERGRPA
jgi:3-hydroxyisobutyrate dehydrogenase-like beta-hydroxyacid dehydrogenase